MALSSKQQVWLEEYLKTWNATEAARRAGYARPRSSGHENLTKPDIAEEIQSRIADKTMSADEALVRLAEQARASYSEYIQGDGSVDLAAMRRDGKMHLVKSTKRTKYGMVVEFHDAQTALLNIGRHHKLFTDKVDLGGELELKQNESALESVLSRIDSIAARVRTAPAATGNSADRERAGSA